MSGGDRIWRSKTHRVGPRDRGTQAEAAPAITIVSRFRLLFPELSGASCDVHHVILYPLSHDAASGQVSVVANAAAMTCFWQLIIAAPTSPRVMHASVPVQTSSGLLDILSRMNQQ